MSVSKRWTNQMSLGWDNHLECIDWVDYNWELWLFYMQCTYQIEIFLRLPCVIDLIQATFLYWLWINSPMIDWRKTCWRYSPLQNFLFDTFYEEINDYVNFLLIWLLLAIIGPRQYLHIFCEINLNMVECGKLVKCVFASVFTGSVYVVLRCVLVDHK